MKHGSLFSGIGGFDLAAEWMGWENVFHCEWNEFGQKILKYYWPNAISYGDITKTDFTIHRGTIDILTGGFPCQPYSMAGKRKGKEDERHLWPEMLRAIREIQPGWIVGENVPGIINWSGGLVFHEVQTDLEAQGYEVFQVVLPACGVNAPHRRDRVWFVAHRQGSSIEGKLLKRQGKGESGGCDSEVTPNTIDSRHKDRHTETGGEKLESEQGGLQQSKGNDNEQLTPDTNSDGFIRRNGKHEIYSGKGWVNAQHDVEQNESEWNVANTNSRRQPSEEHGQKESRRITEKSISGDWQNFPTQPPLCSRDDGISSRLVGITFSKHRNESIKGYGNAVVVPLVYQIFKAIRDYEDNIK